jgi:glycosyltransferase involved in cell wall biosynthesis
MKSEVATRNSPAPVEVVVEKLPPENAARTRAVPLTFIVITRNEERNLAACLASVAGWAKEIFVVDSGSTDRTLEIAEHYGAIVVAHPFETHAKQWNWALNNLPVTTAWILALDADQRVTPELQTEIAGLLSEASGVSERVSGYYVKRRQIFRGKWIRHGGYYPKYLLKLFRPGEGWADEDDLVDHHFRVKGAVAKLEYDIIEDNRNEADITTWIEKHNRYAVLQAREEHSRVTDPEGLRAAFWGAPDERIFWLKNLWKRMPLYVRPFIYFSYRYFLRLGFLDGKQGFIFHFLQAFWYRLLVDIKLDDLRRQSSKES